MCALCLIHVYTCLCVYSCLSLSLRPPPPPCPPLSLLVSFFKCKGGAQSLCVCVWMDAARDIETPQTPPGSLYCGTRPEGPTIILPSAFSLFPVFFFFLVSPPVGSYVPGYGLSLDQFLSLTFLFEELES